MKKNLLCYALAISVLLLCQIANAATWTMTMTPDPGFGHSWTSTMSNCSKSLSQENPCVAVNHFYDGSTTTLTRKVTIQQCEMCFTIRMWDNLTTNNCIFNGSFSNTRHTKADGDYNYFDEAHKPGSIHGTWTATIAD